jgi:asparagine synthase (glutamine-hydrolysing)
MVSAMRHEPRYTMGAYADDQFGVSLGWVSHPGSYSDCMPAVSANNDVTLVFSGEHYAPGSAGNGRPANASSLLTLYEELGDNFFARLNGWFSGLILDRRTNRMTLFNDRYGLGRLYFYQTEEEFLFASEAKALLKVRANLRSIDPDMLAEYLRYNCVLGNRTLFSNMYLLPQASAWSF